MSDPRTIEHNPHEKRLGNGIWWFMWPMIGLQWAGYLYFREFDWWSIALGGGTGLIFAIWAIEITGNKTPEWMKGSAPKASARRSPSLPHNHRDK